MSEALYIISINNDFSTLMGFLFQEWQIFLMDGDAARYLLELCPLKGAYTIFLFSNDNILGLFFFLKIGISSIIHAFFLYNNDVSFYKQECFRALKKIFFCLSDLLKLFHWSNLPPKLSPLRKIATNIYFFSLDCLSVFMVKKSLKIPMG